MRLTKNSYIQVHVRSRPHISGVANRLIDRTLICAAHYCTLMTVSIDISANLKRLEPWASKQADIEVEGHVCPFLRKVSSA